MKSKMGKSMYLIKLQENKMWLAEDCSAVSFIVATFFILFLFLFEITEEMVYTMSQWVR